MAFTFIPDGGTDLMAANRLADSLGASSADDAFDALDALSLEEVTAHLLAAADDDVAALLREMGAPDAPFDLGRLVASYWHDDYESVRERTESSLDAIHVGLLDHEAETVATTAEHYWDGLTLGERARLLKKRLGLLNGDVDGFDLDLRKRGNGTAHRVRRSGSAVNDFRGSDVERNGDDEDWRGYLPDDGGER